jgi:hypothetical protein
MRLLKVMAVLVLVCVSGLAIAELNKFGVADNQRVTFNDPMKVGDIVLPKGEYTVQHTMEGDSHIMVFTQLKASKPAEARVKCQLVPLQEKAKRTQLLYNQDASNVRTLQEVIFAGDTAKHVF